jgi:hypothetical protein
MRWFLPIMLSLALGRAFAKLVIERAEKDASQ